MREEDSNWFARWEEDLPTQEELMPLSQTLITPDLALAFDIRSSGGTQAPAAAVAAAPPLPSSQPTSGEFDSGDMGSGGGAGDEPARTLKRPRLVWTPQLHKRFVDAVAHLGIKNAVPKTIMQLMSVDGLTRENVASHLQKYRLYLKRMQGISASGATGGAGLAAAAAAADPTADHLFSSSPVPPHFFHPAAGRPNSDHYMPFVPVNALQQQQHHHHQMAVAAAAASGHHQQLQPPYHQPHYGSPQGEQFEHPFVPRQSQGVVHRVGGGAVVHNSVPTSYMDDVESTAAMGGRKVLTLFPAGDD